MMMLSKDVAPQHEALQLLHNVQRPRESWSTLGKSQRNKDLAIMREKLFEAATTLREGEEIELIRDLLDSNQLRRLLRQPQRRKPHYPPPGGLADAEQLRLDLAAADSLPIPYHERKMAKIFALRGVVTKFERESTCKFLNISWRFFGLAKKHFEAHAHQCIMPERIKFTRDRGGREMRAKMAKCARGPIPCCLC